MIPALYPGFLKTKEREFADKVRETGKKESLQVAIVQGKLDKFQNKNSFIEQPFIRDEKKTVEEVLAETGSRLKTVISLNGFLYENIEAD